MVGQFLYEIKIHRARQAFRYAYFINCYFLIDFMQINMITKFARKFLKQLILLFKNLLNG